MHWTHFVLISVCAFAYWQRVPAISRVASVFLANSAVVTLWALTVDPTIDPHLQLLVDVISAFIIMADWNGVRATKEQGWFGFILGMRIGSSLAFIRAGVPEAAADYWSLMNMLAQVMMALLLVWSEANGGQLSGFCRRLGRILFRGDARNSFNW
jgi:hypothetical protein